MSSSDNADPSARIYEQLQGLAQGYMRAEGAGHTLQPTALVHEAYLKLGSADDTVTHTHFKALAARAMRRVLVDHARKRDAVKRGAGVQAVTLHDDVALTRSSAADAIDLEQALGDLAANDERKARVVELRFFGGLSIAEAAAELQVSPKTVEADWYMARAWLRRRLKAGADSRESPEKP